MQVFDLLQPHAFKDSGLTQARSGWRLRHSVLFLYNPGLKTRCFKIQRHKLYMSK